MMRETLMATSSLRFGISALSLTHEIDDGKKKKRKRKKKKKKMK